MDVSQTVAEAVAAATQQQQAAAQQAQQLISQPSPPVQPVQNTSSTNDNLTCQWQGCGERCDSAELLYDHVCERHVGRKSTNNLNLTCQWGNCRTTTVKRDHITSHIRVHVPLKPHKCDFCGKAFKRPQDLKKHVKTHADDSVLMNSPQPGANARANGGNGLGPQNGKREYPSHSPSDPEAYLVARLTASSYYGGNDQMNPYPNYQPQMGGPNGAAHYQPNGAQYAGYGSVSYPNNNVQDIQSMDTRRRAIEALNDFLGDIKRRAIDPSSYYDVGQRLQSNSLPLPVASGNGYNTGYNNQSNSYGGFNTASLIDAFSNSGYNVSGATGGSGNGGNGGANVHGPMAQHGYSLPLPNARSKGDLQDIDRFLEQLQATVYETSNSAATAGVQQPGVHSQSVDGFSFGNNHQSYNRPSNSPPSMNSNQGYSSSGTLSSVSGSMPGMTSSASALDTPALTPASVSSYSSGHSPMSSHGRSRTPKQSDVKREASSIDPALRGEESKSPSESSGTPAAHSEHDDKRQEEWVENIRVIEALRRWIADRLRTGEYDGEEQQQQEQHAAGDAQAGAAHDMDASMMETAKMVEKLAEANAAHNAAHPPPQEQQPQPQPEQHQDQAQDQDVKYPSLPA